MSVALNEIIDAFPLVTPHLHQRGMCTCRIYVLLGLRGSTESTTGPIRAQCQRAPLGKIGGMGHPVKDICLDIRLPTCLEDLRLVRVRVAMSGAQNLVQRNGSLAYMRFISLVFVYCLK
jgi:hypothetical protein